MTTEMLWSLVLSGAIGAVGWLLKGYAEEMKRISILLNKTREETAKEYVTKTDVDLGGLQPPLDRRSSSFRQGLQV